MTAKQIYGFCLGMEKIMREKLCYPYSSTYIVVVQMEGHLTRKSERLNSNLILIGKSKKSL
jgi:hypothetical protein